MSLIIPPGFGQAAIEIRNVGDPEAWYVTFGVDLGDIGGDYQLAATAIGAAWGQSLGQRLATDTTSVQTILTVGQDGPENLKVIAPIENGQGPINEAMLPQNCAALIDKTTGVAGRRGRGRMFVPNILIEGQVDSVGNVLSGFRTTLQTAANLLLSTLATDPDVPTPMVLLHGTGITAPIVPTPVSTLFVQPRIATQRRRLRR